jgi:hypothetical protein
LRPARHIRPDLRRADGGGKQLNRASKPNAENSQAAPPAQERIKICIMISAMSKRPARFVALVFVF